MNPNISPLIDPRSPQFSAEDYLLAIMSTKALLHSDPGIICHLPTGETVSIEFLPQAQAEAKLGSVLSEQQFRAAVEAIESCDFASDRLLLVVGPDSESSYLSKVEVPQLQSIAAVFVKQMEKEGGVSRRFR